MVIAVLSVAGLIAGCSATPGTPQATTPTPSTTQNSGTVGAADSAAEVDDALAEPDRDTRQLIIDALERGEIDGPTAWLYRTWAEFGDSQLPAEFDGFTSGHDGELLTQLPQQLDSLPAEIRDQVKPYFLRPTDPASAFTASGEEPPGFRSASQPAQSSAAAEKPSACTQGWTTEALLDDRFRAWACTDMGPDDVELGLALISHVVMTYADEMISDMGTFIPDDPTKNSNQLSDERIDIYLLPAGWAGPHREAGGAAPAYGRTVSASPYAGVTSSAYIMMSLETINNAKRFERALVHELFHMLQYAQNIRVGSPWFPDATAEWAAAHYVRSDSASLHDVRLPILQNTAYKSLQWTGATMHQYGAYLWPLFMEQEVGAESIFKTWQALGSSGAGGGDPWVIEMLNDQLNVADNFPEFVMRMYNAKLPGDPISPRFVSLDSGFPDGRTPTQWETRTLEPDEQIDIDLTNTAGLGYYYAPVKVPPQDPNSDDGVMVTVTGDTQTLSGKIPSLEALVQGVDDEYQRQKINYVGDGQQVCVKDELILVFANPSTRENDYVSGSLQLDRVKDENGDEIPCVDIEVLNPKTLKRLADQGDIVEVDGFEQDGKPDIAPLIVSVTGVKPADVPKFAVRTVISGPTLKGQRVLDWPLSDFTAILAEEDTYHKAATIPLDVDLTNDNRPLTIDTQLLRNSEVVGGHAPTAELHGLTICDIDKASDLESDTAWLKLREGPGCTADINIRYDADFDAEENAVGLASRGEAHLTGALSVTLGPLTKPDKDMMLPPDLAGLLYYPMVAGHWRASGMYSYETCVIVFNPDCHGNDITKQQFSADVDLAGTETGFVGVFETPDGPVLQAAVPVRVETLKTLAGPTLELQNFSESSTEFMSLGCFGDGDWSLFDWSIHELEGMNIGGSGGVPGVWAADRSGITFECSDTVTDKTGLGASSNPYTAEVSVTGSLTVAR